MARAKSTKYGGREDEVEVRQSEVDEEAQLLSEDYEQLELADRSAAHPVSQQPSEDQSRPRRFWARHRTPAWLAFLHGPDPPKIQNYSSLFPSIQELPVRWLHRVLPSPWQRVLLFVLFLLAWAASFAVPLVLGQGAVTDASGAPVRQLSCVDALWKRSNECGLDGIDCQPFSNASFAFRCPAGCAGAHVPEHYVHHVGRHDVQAGARPLVVGGGGGGPYRGDSFLCGAAIHAGVIGRGGGCGVVTLVGEYYQYFSASQHGIDSLAFDSHFPLSFTVAADPALRCTAPDTRWAVSLPLSVFFTTLLALFTTSPSAFFFPVLLGLFTHVAFISDPPPLSTATTALYLPSLTTLYTARLLPTLAIATILYHTTIRHALPTARDAHKHSLTKLLLWLLPAWLGALANHTLLPLLSHAASFTSASPSPATVAALAALATLAAAILLLQLRTLHRESRLPAFLLFYAAAGAGLGVLAALPGVRLHLARGRHAQTRAHLVALLALPLTASRTRLSLVVQGLLAGVFLHGAARAGFETAGFLGPAQGVVADGAGGAAPARLLPELLPPLVERLATAPWTGADGLGAGGLRLWLGWRAEAGEVLRRAGAVGVSVLVNDVERFRGWFAERALEEQVFRYTRWPGPGVVADEYFRFGFVGEGGRALGYGEAGTWFANGSWSQGEGYW